MKSTVFALIAISVVLLVSCSADPESERITSSLQTSYDYDGKLIELEGYVYTDILNSGNNDSLVRIKLHSLPIATDDNLLTSNVYVSKEKVRTTKKLNYIIIPESIHYRPNDIEFVDNNGKKFGLGSKIRIKGIVCYNNKCDESVFQTISDDYTYDIRVLSFTKI